MKTPKTIGVNNGFLTHVGNLLLQIRTTESWMGRVLKKTYKGQWELNDGGVQMKDISETLTFPVLKAQAEENAKKKLGISMIVPDNPEMYLTIYENEEKNILDWAITFVIGPEYWKMPVELLRNVILVDVAKLNALAKRPEGKGHLVSGWGKRQHRTGLWVLRHNSNQREKIAAISTLDSIGFADPPDWYFADAKVGLMTLRGNLGLD